MVGFFRKCTARRRASPNTLSSASTAKGQRLYAIGDIHGRFDLLKILLKKISSDQTGFLGTTRVIFLGDYVDRGPRSHEVIETLSAWEEERLGEAIFLIGNHEQVMLDFLDGAPMNMDWLSYGGLETLRSYGLDLKSMDDHSIPMEGIREALHAQLPDKHRQFLKTLRLFYENGDYYFCHAGVRPDIPLRAQSDHDLLWMREPFLSSKKSFGKIIVHGHTITDEPDVRHNRIGIDTGAWQDGKLTALVLEGKTRRFLFA